MQFSTKFENKNFVILEKKKIIQISKKEKKINKFLLKKSKYKNYRVICVNFNTLLKGNLKTWLLTIIK